MGTMMGRKKCGAPLGQTLSTRYKGALALVVGRFVYHHHHHLLSCLSIYYSIDLRRQTIVYIIVTFILIATYLRSINTSSSTPNPPHTSKCLFN